ncbi:MAG TPA: thioredoxin-like domain-containing protein [Puia sp.]|nr:thioredoxin-like domain-containing protein [Puia sp.]
MKQIIYLVIFGGLSACALKTEEKGDLPSFNLLLVDSTTVLNTSTIPDGKTISLLFFSPDCEHCQEETESIIKNMNSLKNVQFYFVTIDPFDRLKIFNQYYQLSQYTNIILGRDYTFSFPKYFDIKTTPFLAIYNKHKQLKVVLKGAFKVGRIIEEINKL